MNFRSLVTGMLVLFLIPLALQAADEGRLLRFPDIHGDNIVFMYGGDLWTVSADGGTARKLTTHAGLELLPKYSPDGQWIAFTGQYDGKDNVYLIPSEGGEPTQLTYIQPFQLSERHGPENMVLDWHPEGNEIVFMSRRHTYHTWFGHLYSVSIEGQTPQPLRIPKGGLTSFNGDGSKIAYNRKMRNFRTWKRYTGGLAQDIWIYDFQKDTVDQITHWVGTDTDPMWIGDKIFFTSDRPASNKPEQKAPGTMNVWEYDLTNDQFTQRTFFEEYDVRWASAGSDKIIFENGGYLYTLDITKPNTEPQKLTIMIPGDRRLALPAWEETKDLIGTYNAAPTGKRAVFAARGDIYTAPKEHGDVRNLTQTPGIREKYPVWSPDGKWIAYYSDRHGEDDLYVIKDEPGAREIRITDDATVFRYSPIWSPDSKKLAFSDKSFQLWYVDIDKKEPVLVDESNQWEIRDYRWSPDSKWLAYSKNHATDFSSVYVYNLDNGNPVQVTSELTNDWNPAWDPDGKYLYFLSDRHFNPSLGSFDFTYNYHRTAGIYLATLRKATDNPFAPKSDEVKVDEKEDGNKDEEAEVEVTIDFDGLQSRIVALPVEADNYRSLQATKGAIFYITYPTYGLNGKVEPVETTLKGYDFDSRKETEMLSGVGGYDISPDNKHLIVNAKGSYYLVDAKPADLKDTSPLDLSGMEAKIDSRAEWREIFNEAWRYQRDYFYNPQMNNVDWDAMKTKYAELLPYVSHRFDLNYIIGEMVGELSNSHTYVGGGDYPDLDKVEYGQLGIDLTVEDGYFKITRILPGDNSRKSRISPLTKPGIDVSEDMYIIAIDGEKVDPARNFNRYIENKVGKQVQLTVNTEPRERGAHTEVVEPITNEYELRHWAWIENNREKVSKMSDGKIGYVYLTDMSATGLNEFVEQYYPQIRKQGIIIDVRYNGGGFVDQMVLERLRRTLIGMGMSRHETTSTVPPQVFSGYMACLANGYSASDGDIFPYYFKRYELGPVIGTRTWGGVRGIRGNPGIMDGGYIFPPEFSRYDLDSTWNMENYGVEPDIEVDNLPHQVVKGKDPQLETAVNYLLKQMKENPDNLHLDLPPIPDYDKPYPEEYYDQLDIK